MSDLIKKIKIKKQDETYTDYIPIGAEAKNIDCSDGESVEYKLSNVEKSNGKKPYYYNNVADMKADTKLKTGDMAVTLGYYEPNDGGAATYQIIDTENQTEHQEELDNELYAILIVKNNVNIKQFGAKGDGTTDDTNAIQNCINYVQKKHCKMIISIGTFLVSKLVITSRLEMEGLSLSYSVIKSINNNPSKTGVIEIQTSGLRYSKLSNFKIEGNNVNQTNKFDGIYLYSNNSNDYYTNLERIDIYSCSGSGISVRGANTNHDIREIKINNVSIYGCEIGLNVLSCSDSFFNNIIIWNCIKNGFYFKGGGSHKISNCKAFWNGQGENLTIDLERTPSSAYAETLDEQKDPSKTYYTRSGKGKWYSPYKFTKFNGSEFDEGTVYYELIKNYYKRYEGFGFYGCQSLAIINCEAQDNMGDGFLLSQCNDVAMSSVIGDNNGLLRVNGKNVSYLSQGLEQIYCGVFIYKSNYINVSGEFRNFRFDSVGACQRSAIGNWQSAYINATVTEQKQIEEYFRNDPSLKTQNININGHTVTEFYDLTDCTIKDEYSIWTPKENNPTAWDMSFLKKVGNSIIFKIIVTKDNSNIPNEDITNLLKLPSQWQPNSVRGIRSYLSENHGYTLNKLVNCIITRDGNITYRPNTSDNNTYQYLVIEGSYDLDY